ncbi:PAS domain S-box protein [Mesorhizobium sp. B2-1-3A]|uniref:PAS domain-containing sensor histidine kinase n=1 Tax=Mesorhizobium sp. B2-1-3A TaxID=2589971 RepID=UPI00112BE6CC|nr:PAS domain S-box protein [Mesorhizobium sp. B2-1-3A]TPM95038.1 PAS domain S-box protein [Mesorhizobium sp. B2-1-3A]
MTSVVTNASRRSLSPIDYADFFENGGVCLHVVDAEGRILHANNAELDLLGVTADEYIGSNIVAYHADEASIRDILDRLNRGEAVTRHPATLRARDGSLRQVEVSSSGSYQDGKLEHTRCFTIDVTRFKAVEEAMTGQKSRFHQVLDALPMAVYTTDVAGKITYYNRAAANLAGREPVIGVDEWCVTLRLYTAEGEELPRDECPMAIALKENRPVRDVEAIGQRPDGSFFPFLPFPTPLHDAEGNLTGGVNMLLDLSDRKAGEEAAQRLSAIVESSFDAIVSKDLNGVIQTWNSGAQRLFGYPPEEAIGQNITMLIPPDHQDEEPRIIEQIRAGVRVESFETIRRRKNGELVPVSLTISPVRNAAGRIVGASKIARDVSAAKESEHRIRMLMREVNHRVKNQYAVILSMIRETNKRSQSPDEFERQVRERIMALSRSHDLLVSVDWKGATLKDLLEVQAKPFPRGELITTAGPELVLSPNAVQYLGIAFHELCTNSAKYGVLAGHEGSLHVTWTVTDQGRFTLEWVERDGPAVQSINKPGFGSVVLRRVAPQALGGTGELEHSDRKIVWRLEAPLAFVGANAQKAP